MEPQWTISELAEQAAAALGDEPVRVNGRVRDVPTARLIRWYATIGLMDPPSGRQGRTALYGRRHLLQLVAIKRRQAAGRSIAQIQSELVGATDATLTEIARLPDTAPSPGDGRAPARGRFWAQPVAATPPARHVTPRRERPAAVPAVRLAPGATLLLDTTGLTAADLDAIGAAAAPLLAELRRRGLIPAVDAPAENDGSSDPNGSQP
ncbi:MAG TPA: MerR family transcriptional regulator [Thermomonospora sp.]|nr:MerR family transcriptional regulator [Thermomonospora sp.]